MENKSLTDQFSNALSEEDKAMLTALSVLLERFMQEAYKLGCESLNPVITEVLKTSFTIPNMKLQHAHVFRAWMMASVNERTEEKTLRPRKGVFPILSALLPFLEHRFSGKQETDVATLVEKHRSDAIEHVSKFFEVAFPSAMANEPEKFAIKEEIEEKLKITTPENFYNLCNLAGSFVFDYISPLGLDDVQQGIYDKINDLLAIFEAELEKKEEEEKKKNPKSEVKEPETSETNKAETFQ